MDPSVDVMVDPRPGMETPIPYVCMPGSPYTGSTLLGMLLGNHPACASIGAATGLTARVDLSTYLCSCGAKFTDCGFWGRVAQRTVELQQPVTVFEKDFWNTHVRVSNRRSLNGLAVSSLGSAPLDAVRDAVLGKVGPVAKKIAEAKLASWSLARAVLEETGKTMFVDTARDHQRHRYLAGMPLLDVKVIHLVRDPRGNVASIMKHTKVGARKAARQWRHYNVEADRVRRRFPRSSWMLLRYEDLCQSPQVTLDRVAEFIGVEPVPIATLVAPSERHVIGNSMRLTELDEIHEDLSWQLTLRGPDLRTIAKVVGRTSHRLGYDWP
ncbi:MAG: sulfotransferase [Actinomycetota bacterium]